MLRRELSDSSVRALEAVIPPVESGRGFSRRLEAIAAEAERDLRFHSSRRHRSLGDYVQFLRTEAGLTLSEAGKKLRIDFQWLADLERDGLSPTHISARRLATVLRRLGGSLQQAEALLLTLLRSPRFVPTSARTSLFRPAPGAGRAEAEAASREARGEEAELRENPEWAEEMAGLLQLRKGLRESW